MCILRRELLVQLVEECMAHNRYSFRHHILQDQKDRLHLHAYVWQGYAARIDTVQTYYRRSMELLDPAQRRLLFDPQRPILAKENDAPPTYLDPPGCARIPSLPMAAIFRAAWKKLHSVSGVSG